MDMSGKMHCACVLFLAALIDATGILEKWFWARQLG